MSSCPATGLAVVRVAHDLANAVLPHALFIATLRWPKEPFLEVAETSFAFLDRATTVENVFWPVGNNGWYQHGEYKASHDQQPVEAATMADAALAGFGLTSDEKYRHFSPIPTGDLATPSDRIS